MPRFALACALAALALLAVPPLLAADDGKATPSPADGLQLTVHALNGDSPAEVLAALLSLDGRQQLAGRYPVGAGGQVTIPGEPVGHWLLVVSASTTASVTLAVDVPGPRVTVDLPETTDLTVLVPDLHAPTPANLRISSHGVPYRSLIGDGVLLEGRLFVGGRIEIHDLPPGTWQLRVDADGKTYRETVFTSAGSPTQVTLKTGR